jgi:alpha-tubulin suppressor-like RCC1 family protein
MEVNELYCIGSNKFGQAGAGKKYHNQSFAIFNKIVFPVFIKQVVCGSHHTGLLTLEGLVYMMGSNINGALGSPVSSINYSYSPILVPNLNDVNKISTGHYHMCAISEGRLYSWGKGVDGQLGNGKLTNCSLPTEIDVFGDDVEDVSCGLNHTLVKTTSQKCYSFGNGIYGQLGIGSNKNSALPTLVKIDKVTEIAAG